MLGSIFDSGAVYYPTILLLPIIIGLALARWRPGRKGLWRIARLIVEPA